MGTAYSVGCCQPSAYVAVMRAIVGHNRRSLALAVLSSSRWVGQTGFLTAALIGGTLI